MFLCSGASGGAFKWSEKENYSDVSKVCYPRCIRTVDKGMWGGGKRTKILNQAPTLHETMSV